ncbi:ankyrin repeat domain-containing protein EMB506, chloroplastic-like isoform X1 [Camellia sinensis]|uniref:ankyrin repeat domain-containing protein EMB506, chloroplastic-like isoform X1 n=1 Tax=Camellia sinensis TaxID=4442 RepID=UPI0010356472|nr:ankyrin repeat domain-containing protein EMB506, chloroplastic-like isoform X1 [Camellia sinensis]
MMVPIASATFPLKQLFPIYSFTNTMSKVITANPERTSFTLPVAEDRPNVSRIYAFESNRVSYSPRNQALWEDPDDGTGSEYDDDNEENNLDFEREWEEEDEEEESVSSATASYSADKPSTTTDISAEDLLKEVEQLLGLEERDILQQNATPNLGKISTAKWNPFHSLGLAGQIHYMDMLLGNGLHIDLADKDGMTALHTAIIGKKEAVVSHLLRKGANPNIRDRDGASPLHYAVQVGAMQTVKILIKYNVDVNASDNFFSQEGWTPLHIAIQTRNRDIAKVILVNGADKTRRNKDGKTPLDLALCYGKDFKSYDLAKLLKLVPANRYL